MKAWKKFLFISIAYSITLLHTVVPHEHSNVAPGELIVQARSAEGISLIGFLQIFFSADLGGGHLEKFNKSTASDTDLSFAGILLYPALVLLVAPHLQGICPKPATVFVEKLRQRLLLSSSKPLRAPPALV